MRDVGGYTLLGEIASGGMATVFLGRRTALGGFSRTVAIKRLLPPFAKDDEFVSMLLDEGRLTAQIHHPNVVQTHDVLRVGEDVLLVMDFVEGEVLSRLIPLWKESPPTHAILSSILSGVLHGLHAAHELKAPDGTSLQLVHRDASPHNIIVGIDGTPRILDFGVARALGRLVTTREGEIKGKVPYMSPEQLRGRALDRRSDVYTIGVVLWECLTEKRLFSGDEWDVVERILLGSIPRPSEVSAATGVFDDIVQKATARDPQRRFGTAKEMADAIERAVRPALPAEVAEWLDGLAGSAIRSRAERAASLVTRGDLTSSPARSPSSSSSPSSAPPSSSPSSRKQHQSGGADESTGTRAAGVPRLRLRSSHALIAGLGAGCLLALSVRHCGRTPEVTAQQASTSAQRTPSPSASASPASGVTEPFDLRAEPPDASAQQPLPVRSVVPPAPQRRPSVPAPLRPARPQVDCTVPYVVDELGTRTYKRECVPTGASTPR